MVLTDAQSQSQAFSQTQSDAGAPLPVQHQKGKFDHLLKPIKNIALSWGIDIAAELSSYAANLGITLDAGGGEGHNVDFAEAALLLQGTTTIYCRKIEHLYTLVLAAVEAVNQVKARKSRTSADGEGNDDADSGVDDACWISDELDFLSLDIPELDEKDLARRERDSGTFRKSGNDPTLLAEVPHLLRAPIGSDSTDISGNGVLRISLGTLDESGALLLRGSQETKFELADDHVATPKKFGTPSNVPLSFEDDDYDHAPSPEFMRNDISPLPFRMDENDPVLKLAAAQAETKPLKPWLASLAHDYSKQKSRERERVDPFIELDPHDDMGIRPRPVRMRSTVSKPKPSPKEECEKVELCLADIVLGPLPTRGSLNKHVSFAALEEPVSKMRKKRIAMKRRRPGLSAVRIVDVERERDDDLDGGGDLFGNGGLYGDDDLADDGDDGGISSPLLSMTDDLALPDIGEDLGLPTYNRGLLGTDRYWQDVVDGYQQACKRYMQETTSLWEKQVVNADLVERVEKWREKIAPALALEEKRPPYDIQGYGDIVLKRVAHLESEEKPVIKMKKALQCADQYEGCRMFIATLQLANNYDLEIIRDESDDYDPKVKLLDSARVEDIRRPPPPSAGTNSAALAHTEEALVEDVSVPRRTRRRAPLADVTANELNIENTPTIALPVDKETLVKTGRRASSRKRTRTSVSQTPASKRKTVRKRTYLR